MSITVTLNIERESTAAIDCDPRGTAQAVCGRVLESEGCPLDTEVSLLLVDDAAMREINRSTRGIDAATDVLSFPNLSFAVPRGNSGFGDPPGAEDSRRAAEGETVYVNASGEIIHPSDWESAMSCAFDCLDPETGCLFLGDIVLNLDRVRLQAAEYGHSERREFAFLVVHSMLHLCGYDHMTEEQASVMFGRQEEVLHALGITR